MLDRRLLFRRHQQFAQLQPSAQSRRRLRDRAGPGPPRQRTSEARESCILLYVQERDARPFRERQLHVACFRKTDEHFANQRGPFPAVKKLTISGLPILRRAEEFGELSDNSLDQCKRRKG